eukprot:TRINITY_DN2673_c0_g1_i1.p2 TRINITY_DN2673_c0_g1~~TRINITY_DN2673_c0_g1_i1.p2  ORF type:complete len:299 (-),score=120.31 TRINITY_DN2673_c0_g1_i1:213-1109(-)
MMAEEQRPRALIGAAAALYMFSLVEVSPSFVAPQASSVDVRRSAAPSLRGGAADVAPAASSSLFSRTSCQVASTFLTLSACALASRTKAKKSQRSTRTKLFSEGGQAVVCFSDALADAAVKKEESRAVTQDVMKVKDMMDNEEFLEELKLFINEPFQTETVKADGIVKLLSPMESTVFPKYVKFLSKKKRLPMLTEVIDYYMKMQYKTQGIEPVRILTAQRLTDEQRANVIEKMKKKSGAADIKLIEEVRPELVAGMVIEWAFTDPDELTCPTEGIDLSLKNVVKRAAVKEGVPVLMA